MLCIETLIDASALNSARVRYGTSPSSASTGIDSLGAKVHSCDADGGRSPHLGRARAYTR